MREYAECTINIIQVLILKVIGVDNISKINTIFESVLQTDNFFLIKRLIFYEKQQINKNTNELLKKKLLGFDQAISCILRLRSTTCAIPEVTINHLNVID